MLGSAPAATERNSGEQDAATMKNQTDSGILIWMKANNIPLSLDNYIALNWWHRHKLGIEEIVELPRRFQHEALERLERDGDECKECGRG